MNPQTHRVIFNKSRGCMMAVSEVASSQGKGKACKKLASTALSASKLNSSHFYSSNTAVGHTLLALLASKSIAIFFRHAKASVVDAQGGLSATAARDINLTEGQQASSTAYAMRTSSSGFLSASSAQLRTGQDSTQAVGSSFGGGTVTLNAERDINIKASSVIGDKATTAVAGNNINITAGQNTSGQTYFYEKKESGLLSAGGLGISIGKREQSNADAGQSSTAAASTVGSINGNVNLIAGNQYRQVGSDVMAPGGDVSIVAKAVDIVEARQTNASQSQTKFRQSGLTTSIASPLIAAAQQAQGMAQAAGNASDARTKALAGAATALSLYNSAPAISDAAKALASGNPMAAASINVSLGSSKSQNNSASTADTASSSTVAAGNNVSIIATGGGAASNLTVRGSTITAGNNALLAADNNLSLTAALNQTSQTSSNKASSGSIGVSYSAIYIFASRLACTDVVSA